MLCITNAFKSDGLLNQKDDHAKNKGRCIVIKICRKKRNNTIK